MSTPTPITPRLRDDQFDAQLTRLLAGDLSAADEVEPGLQDIALDITRLARDANWLSEDPGPAPTRLQRSWMTWEPVLRAMAAVLVVAMIGSVAILGYRAFETRDEQPMLGTQPVSQVVAEPGECTRAPMAEADIQRVIRANPTAPVPGDPTDVTHVEGELLQLTRDWDACQRDGKYQQSLSYQSVGMIQRLGVSSYAPIASPVAATEKKDVKKTPTSTTASTPFATTQGSAHIVRQQSYISPLMIDESVEIRFYALQWMETDPKTHAIQAAELWVVPVDASNEWTVWPVRIEFRHENGQWVIAHMERAPGGKPSIPARYYGPATPVAKEP